MFRNLTYRQKLRYLLIGAFVLLIICYKFSINKTIQEYKTYRQYKTNANSKNAEAGSMSLLETKNDYLNETLNRFVLDTLDQSKNLLGIVSGYCKENNLKVKEYKPGLPVQTDSITVVTRSTTVEGSFINCLKLLNYLETQTTVGRIGSVLFKSYTNPGNNETILNCTVFVQNLIPNK